jgi:hypothetical protein
MSNQGTFDHACSLIEAVLRGTTREDIVADVSKSANLGKALPRLCEIMRAGVLTSSSNRISLAGILEEYDRQTRREGFHVLHDWDGKADTVNANTIPIDVLNYLIDKRGTDESDGAVLAILLDYHFLYVLALLSLRAWDEGNADQNLDRVTRLLGDLQSERGSGQKFAADAETLILIATSHFELDDRGYGTLLEKARTLDQSHRSSLALVHAASFGSHLRFGFEAPYGRDTTAMRDDNGVDYQWLCFSLATLMRQYSRTRDEGVDGTEKGEMVTEAILNGLSADAAAFLGDHPASLAAFERERSEFSELFHECRQDLLKQFERYRPSERGYSPLSLFFNFAHNVLKGMVVDALLWGEAWSLTLNDLLTAIPRGGPKGEAKERLAKTLMRYARANPDTIRGRLMPVIVYDPETGHQAFTTTLRKIRESDH